MADAGRREKDLSLVEDFEYVRAVTAEGNSVRVPKSLFGGNLEVANENVLGGIKASPKEASDTNEVKIDPNTGKLYCPPSEVSMATSEKIGGIVAEIKTSEETEEVKIDPNTGKAYVKPSSKLEVATSEKLGGIKAEPKTDIYTVEAKIDESTGKLYVPEGEGTPPDDEDLTITTLDGSKVLQFKDRDSSRGKGYVILRAGKSLASQMTMVNTIYEIRYDFDLEGATITIPSGCVLDFRGGSFNNGTIEGKNTSIKAGKVTIFKNSLNLSGTWKVENTCPEWFGAVGDGINDDRLALQKCFDFCKTIKVIELNPSTTYLLNSLTDTTNNIALVIDSAHDILIKSNGGIYKSIITMGTNAVSVIGLCNRTDSVKFEHIKVNANNKADYALKSYYDNDPYLSLDHCTFSNANKSAARLATFVSTINHCVFTDSNVGLEIGAEEFSAAPCTSITFTSCYSNYCNTGYKIHHATYCTFNGCACDHSDLAYSFESMYGLSMNACGAETSKQWIDAIALRGFSINGFYSYDCGGDSASAKTDYMIHILSPIGGTISGLYHRETNNYNYILGVTGKSYGFENLTITDGCIRSEETYVASSNYYYAYPITFANNASPNFKVTASASQTAFTTSLKYYVNRKLFSSNSLTWEGKNAYNTTHNLTLPPGNYDGTSLSNINGGDLIIESSTGNRDDVIITFVTDNESIKNCHNIIFRNVTITKDTPSPYGLLLRINNSNVSFINCVFLSNGNRGGIAALIGFSKVYFSKDCITSGNFHPENIANNSLVLTDEGSEYYIEKVTSSELSSCFKFLGAIVYNKKPQTDGILCWIVASDGNKPIQVTST